jgi:hypothetical protein
MRHRAVSLAAGLLLILAARPGSAMSYGRFDVSVIVDGVPLEEYAYRGRTYVEAQRSRTFTLRVSNPTSERVAVAVSVDGRNVIDAKRTSAQTATKWVLFPGQTMEIPGWQISGETARRFFFTDTARSYAKWLGDTANVGTIEAVFYREKMRLPAPIAKDPAPAERFGQSPDEAPMNKEDRRLRSEAPATQPSAGSTGGEVGMRDQAAKSRVESDEMAATGIGQRTSFPVEWVAFDEEPTPVARIALRYEYRRELVRLGVLSSHDGLAARERARGFEPEYAPDPDRHRSQ